MSKTKATWTVFGTATVSVAISVEASSPEEALKLAREASSYEWTCYEVDGDVALDTEPPQRED
jgi:hypothetical protein